MCKNGLRLMVVLGASCCAAVFVMTHAVQASSHFSGAFNVLGDMSFALAVMIETDA